MLAQSIRTHLALARGDSATALEELQNMKFAPRWELAGPVFFRSLDRYLLAELLDALGRSEEALLWFEGIVAQLGSGLAPSHRRRGEILERLGRTEEALEHYRRFLDLWQNCDAELQPQFEEVKKRVEALAGAS
jgi:tetratricopeptide (TPR) repeat protein